MVYKVKRLLFYVMAPIAPTWCSKRLYRSAFGRELNLRNPITLNEKLMWLKLNCYRDDPLVAQCADKYAVRDYVRKCGCEGLLNELVGVWDNAEEINWSALPEKFVLKCNHASGFNWICPDKSLLDIRACKKQLKKWMRRDFWRFSAELQYRRIPKKIICEKFLGEGKPLIDYKFYCFHGEPTCIVVCCEREKGWPHFYFFDCDWNFIPLTRDGKKQRPDFTLPKPAHLGQMVEAARKLSQPFPFVRVDLYDTDDSAIFGELTFTPSACLDVDRLPESDLMFGKLLNLDRK